MEKIKEKCNGIEGWQRKGKERDDVTERNLLKKNCTNQEGVVNTCRASSTLHLPLPPPPSQQCPDTGREGSRGTKEGVWYY